MKTLTERIEEKVEPYQLALRDQTLALSEVGSLNGLSVVSNKDDYVTESERKANNEYEIYKMKVKEWTKFSTSLLGENPYRTLIERVYEFFFGKFKRYNDKNIRTSDEIANILLNLNFVSSLEEGLESVPSLSGTYTLHSGEKISDKMESPDYCTFHIEEVSNSFKEKAYRISKRLVYESYSEGIAG